MQARKNKTLEGDTLIVWQNKYLLRISQNNFVTKIFRVQGAVMLHGILMKAKAFKRVVESSWVN